MAEIFLGRSASLDGFEKELVIKRIRPDVGDASKFFSMFIDEARISISLSHPNIVQVFDFGEVEGSYYLAMEYVHGCDVARLCYLSGVRGKGLPPPLALVIMGETVKGLEYAHNKKSKHGDPLNVVHRDISPQNILLSFDGHVKLADFGIAKARGKVSQTNPGMVLGKLAYMAPEQLRGDPLDRRTDVFACGVVMWEMLAGRSLYGAAVKSGVYERILEAQIDPPSTHNSSIPPELDALVMKAVAKEASNRYQSARELGYEIHAYLVRHHPDVNIYNLQSFLDANRDELTTEPGKKPVLLGTRPVQEGDRQGGDRVPTRIEPQTARIEAKSGPVFEWSPALIKTIEQFHKRPSLWHLVRMAEICHEEGKQSSALACYRVAAAKFAQRGLLAQCLYACRQMLQYGDRQTLIGEIAGYPSFMNLSDAEVQPRLFKSEGSIEELLTELLAEVQPGNNDVGQKTPLLGHLDGKVFAELAENGAHVSFEEGHNIVQEGQAGRSMYLIARGRVLVHATGPNGQRVYLSSLTAGDFFGENGFFTGAPRSATVEVLYRVDAFEIDRNVFSRLTATHPELNGVLLGFYKERIADAMLAKSPIFGLLGGQQRRAVIAQFTPRVFRAGEHIIKEGARSDRIYIIKDGEAEVFTESGGERTALSTIGAGTIFGEVGALRDIPRTASVAAKGKLECLELPAGAFNTILDETPDVKKRVLEVVAQRARDNIDKVMGPSPFAPKK